MSNLYNRYAPLLLLAIAPAIAAGDSAPYCVAPPPKAKVTATATVAAPAPPPCVAAPAGAGFAGGGRHVLLGGEPHPDGLDRDALWRRGIGIGIGGAASVYMMGKVSEFSHGLVDFGKVGNVPGGYGHVISHVPFFGGALASGSLVPVTLGQVPLLGTVVSRVPLVGHTIAGPANPVLVGAVAIDNYVIPKYSPLGYTRSSIYAATNDFNNPPKLLNYKNYLAPLPYTHPPIYAASTLNTDTPVEVEREVETLIYPSVATGELVSVP